MIRRLIKICFFLLFISCFEQKLQAQIHNVDSLQGVFKSCAHDTCRATQYIWISESWNLLGKQDSSLKYAEAAAAYFPELQKSQDPAIKKYLSSALPRSYVGLCYHYSKKDPVKAESLYKTAIRLKEEEGMVDMSYYTLLHNHGNFLKNQGRKEEAIPEFQHALEVAEKKNFVKQKYKTKLMLAEIFIYNNPDLALEYLADLDAYYKQAGEHNSRGHVNKYFGMIYSHRGEYVKCISHYQIALDLALQYGSPTSIGSQYINMGGIYYNMSNYPKALEYFNLALEIGEKNKLDVITAGALIFFGTYYAYIKKDLDKAAFYLKSSRDIRIKLKMLSDAAYASRHLAAVYLERGDTLAAEEELNIALKGWLAGGDKRGEATANIEMARIKFYRKQYEAAEQLVLYAKAQGEEIKSLEVVRESTKLLSEIAQATGKYETALSSYKTFITMRDSSNNIEQQREALKKQLDYEMDKKETLLRLEKEKQQISFMEELKRQNILFEFEQKQLEEKAKQKQLSLQFQEELKRKDLQSNFELENEKKRLEQEQKDKLSEEEKSRQRVIMIAVIGVLIIVVVFTVLIWNRFKVTKQQNIKIEEQKKLVEEQRDEISEQHHILGEKTKEILDSITYAKRIQAAILPQARLLNERLPENFILYKPKDIVAGDFYWLETKDHLTMLAAADCTGHGVPGAMVSVVCNNALNRSVREYGLTDPGEILNKTREIVIAEFEKSDEEVKDGMDISLAVIDKINKTVKWAGANNPLWIIRENALTEIKPNKQPIGKYSDLKPFTTHTVSYQSKDMIYLFTDGYADQFGGDHLGSGKKFKSSQMKELLLQLANESLSIQKEKINSRFEDWKGNLEQIDDVCIIAVRL